MVSMDCADILSQRGQEVGVRECVRVLVGEMIGEVVEPESTSGQAQKETETSVSVGHRHMGDDFPDPPPGAQRRCRPVV